MIQAKRPESDIQVYLALTAFLLGALALALSFGSTSDWSWDIVREFRAPRALLAIAVGMGLSLAGVILQALFANPLCEPYTLGISSGSALGAVVSASLGWTALVYGIAPTAFLGALAFAWVLDLISRRGGASQALILLSGVMLGFVGSSLVALWMALADPAGIQGALVWLLGDLSRARWEGALVILGIVLLGAAFFWRDHRSLDALLFGEEHALALGVDVRKHRRRWILATSVLIGVCVSAAGMIGFIGLLVPHLARSWRGSLHRRLIPVSALLGAVVLLLADTLARVVARPYELPVGVITALIGAPLFVFLLIRKGGRR